MIPEDEIINLDENNQNLSFDEFDEILDSLDSKSEQVKSSVFTAEWRGKADILTLRIRKFGRYPIAIYSGNYMSEACEIYSYDKHKHKM